MLTYSICLAKHIEIVMPSRRLLLAAAIAAPALLATALPALAGDTVVFAAASLKNALDDVAAAYTDKTGKTVAISYAGTSTLVRQIEQGAPADIFFSADATWMDYAIDNKLVKPETRRTLLGNDIVLVVPKDSAAAIAMAPGMDLAGLLGPDGYLAMANVESVPAGKYGRASLETLGVWDSVATRVVQSENVRLALAFVARGEATAGIVYATDAAAEPAVKVIGTFPADSHRPILYPVAMTAGSTDPDAMAFFDFLRSDAAAPAYRKQGFTVVSPGS
jgi:molybdate transport system substrate-binding protein